jgi:integrase
VGSRRGAGEGSLFYDENEKLWVGTVDFGIVAGKRRRVVRKAKTRAALLTKMRDLQRQRDQGVAVPSQRTTTGEWLEHWCDNVLPNADLAPATVAGYRTVCAAYVTPHVGHVPLARLSTTHVEAMMTALRRQPSAHGRPGVSPRTAGYARAVLRMALRHAELHGHVTRNVAALVRPPRQVKAWISDRLDADQARRVLDQAGGDRLEALAVLALATGMRRGECLALRWDRVDLDDGSLYIPDAKTAAGVRPVALPPMVVDALRAHRKRQAAERLAAPVWSDPGLVFATPLGTPLPGRDVLAWWHRLTVAAGVGRRRFHATRHTAATLMLNNGVPLEVVSKNHGHASLAITADVYAEVLPQLQRKAADAMQNVLSTGGPR